MELFNYGKYVKFNNSKADVEINIQQCDEKQYIYQDKDGINLKSCYKPICDPPCINGKCVSDNYCECNGTVYKGKTCNEYYKLERNGLVDLLVFINSIILMILIVTIIIGVFVYKDNSIIKAGSFDFLIIILLFHFVFFLFFIFNFRKIQIILHFNIYFQ